MQRAETSSADLSPCPLQIYLTKVGKGDDHFMRLEDHFHKQPRCRLLAPLSALAGVISLILIGHGRLPKSWDLDGISAQISLLVLVGKGGERGWIDDQGEASKSANYERPQHGIRVESHRN